MSEHVQSATHLPYRVALAVVAVCVAAVATFCVSASMPQGQAHAVTAAEARLEADIISEHIDAMQSSLNSMQALHDKSSAEQAEAERLRDEAAVKVEEQSARVEELQEKMSSFAVSMYKDDGASTFLTVLLQTVTFQDFLVNWDRCAAVSHTGKALIQEERAACDELEAARKEYDDQSKRAARQMKIAEASMAQISAIQGDLRDEVEKLTEEADKLEAAEKQAAAKAQASEKAQSTTVTDPKGKKQELTGEEARKAEEERKAKEAEIEAQRKAKEAQAEAKRQADQEESEERARKAAEAIIAAAASAHPQEGADVLAGSDLLEGDGFFTNPCPDSVESSGFGYRDFDESFHKGLDMAASWGTPYYAADSGTVIYATNDGSYNGGAGNWIVIAHGNGIVTKYMHSATTFVKPGDQVVRGQNIGLVGSTGNSSGPHLHFQVEVDGVAVNPAIYL